MPFSLTNAPITFQSYIYKALGTLVDTIYIVYLDNILIYLNNEDKHVKHVKYVKQVLQQLRAQGLYAKLLKYIFYTKNVKFLGFIITPRGIIIDLNRVKAIKEWPKPKSYRDIQVFLSFANFYRRFIQNYLDTIYSLYVYLIQAYRDPILDREKKQKRKLKGPTKWHQPQSQPNNAQQAFCRLYAAFIQAPLLYYFNPVLPLILITNAFNYAYSGILLQPLGQGD